MTQYRDKTTGVLKTKAQIIKENPRRSLDRPWNAGIHASLNIDPVLASPKPTPSLLQRVVLSGAEEDALGNWVENWTLVDINTGEGKEIEDQKIIAHHEALRLDTLALEVEKAAVDLLNDKAKSMGYDSIETAVSYAGEDAVLQFQREGTQLRIWRSLVWAALYETMARVLSGEIPEPTLEEAIAMLPVPTI